MKSNPIKFAALLLAFAVGGLAALTNAEEKKSSLNSADEKFLKKTGEAGMSEVKIATLGTQKAERADVKDFATMLVADHTKVNDELSKLAQTKGVELSAVISADAADTFKDLEKESGKDFDKAFLAHLEKSHKDSISAFEEAGKDAADSEVKSWANQTLPTLKAHLEKVQELQKVK